MIFDFILRGPFFFEKNEGVHFVLNLQQKYIRKAPIKYRLMFWSTLLKFIAHKFKGALFSYNAEYDSINHNIKFA